MERTPIPTHMITRIWWLLNKASLLLMLSARVLGVCICAAAVSPLPRTKAGLAKAEWRLGSAGPLWAKLPAPPTLYSHPTPYVRPWMHPAMHPAPVIRRSRAVCPAGAVRAFIRRPCPQRQYGTQEPEGGSAAQCRGCDGLPHLRLRLVVVRHPRSLARHTRSAPATCAEKLPFDACGNGASRTGMSLGTRPSPSGPSPPHPANHSMAYAFPKVKEPRLICSWDRMLCPCAAQCGQGARGAPGTRGAKSCAPQAGVRGAANRSRAPD